MANTIAAVEKARQLIQLHNPDTIVPFPFQDMISQYGDLELVYSSTTKNGISGAVLYDTKTEKYRILINSDEPEVRRNFSLAHELGHYFLHQDELKKQKDEGFISSMYGYDNALLRSSSSIESREVETQANAFAAELLMPEQKVRQVFSECKNFTIEDFAKIFHVSCSAMAVRMDHLRLLDYGRI